MKPCQTGKLASKKGVTLGNQSAQEEIDTAHPLGTDALGGESEDTIVLSPSLSTTLSPDLSFYLPPSSLPLSLVFAIMRLQTLTAAAAAAVVTKRQLAVSDMPSLADITMVRLFTLPGQWDEQS